MILRVLAILIIFSTTSLKAQTLRERLAGFSAGAHQGGIYNFTQNTLKRFKKAQKQGVDIIEMDLRLTKDNEVIIYHDADFSATTTTCKGPVANKTLAEVRKCKFRLNNEKIPTLRQVIEWANGRVVINAEFKEQQVVIPAIKLVQEYHAYDWIFFQTKSDPARYQLARDFDKDVALLFVPKTDEMLDWAVSLNDDNLVVIELHENMRRRDVIDKIHQANKLALEDSWRYVFHKEVLKAACDKVFALGIDIAISNSPASCVKQRSDAERSLSYGF